MPTPAITEAYVRHTLQVIRVGNGLNAQVQAQLRALARSVRALLVDADLDRVGRAQLRALQAEIGAAIEATYAGIATRQAEASRRVITAEAAWAARTGRYAVPVSDAVLARAATGLAVMGNPTGDHWAQQAAALRFRMASELNQAVRAGQAPNDVLARVLGQGRDLRGGPMEAAQRNARGLVDATAQASADAGRREAMRANGVDSLRWHAVLDPMVCPSCGERAGKLWTMDGEPIAHDIPYAPPPLHPWCRCILLPMKHPGGEPPEDGGPQVDRFDKWLEGIGQEQQEEVLGVGRAELWREGTITTSDLIGQNGMVLTLRELEEIAGGP